MNNNNNNNNKTTSSSSFDLTAEGGVVKQMCVCFASRARPPKMPQGFWSMPSTQTWKPPRLIDNLRCRGHDKLDRSS